MSALPHSSVPLPLVYACSGCSNVAQLANTLAVRLDRERHADMSCIAGVGGDVRKLVRTARSGRAVLAIDGCPLACAKHCLARQGVTPDVHVLLNEWGLRKRYHGDVDEAEVAGAYHRLLGLLRTLRNR